jgi:hypothetical protein
VSLGVQFVTRFSTKALCISLLSDLSSDQEVVPARNVIDALAYDCMVNDESVLPILKALIQCTHSLLITKMLDV